MKTEELITMLATGAAPMERGGIASRFAPPLAGALIGVALLMAVTLGVRSDLAQVLTLPMFWAKLLIPAIAALAALRMAIRLSCPGRSAGLAPLILAALLLLASGGAALSLFNAPAAERAAMIFSGTWKTCTMNITLLALPLFGAAFWVIKGLAPTRPAWAGASAGLLAGAAAAAVYALHCPEMAAPFLGVWYVLGIIMPAVLGALIGPRFLRW